MMSAFVFVLCLVAMVMAFVYLLAKQGMDKRDRRYGDEDTALTQELERGLRRMEDRIESLETLLMDRAERSQERAKRSREDVA